MQMSPIRLYCINGMVELLTALKPRRRLFITSSRKWFYKKYYTIRTNKCRVLIIIDGYHLPIPHENHIEVSQKHWLRHVQEREKHAKNWKKELASIYINYQQIPSLSVQKYVCWSWAVCECFKCDVLPRLVVHVQCTMQPVHYDLVHMYVAML